MPNKKVFKSTKTKSRPRLSQRGGRKSTKSKSLSKKLKDVPIISENTEMLLLSREVVCLKLGVFW